MSEKEAPFKPERKHIIGHEGIGPIVLVLAIGGVGVTWSADVKQRLLRASENAMNDAQSLGLSLSEWSARGDWRRFGGSPFRFSGPRS